MSVYVASDSHDSHEEALVLATETSRCATITALASNGRIGLIRHATEKSSGGIATAGAFLDKGGGAFFGMALGWPGFTFPRKGGGAFFGGG